MASNQKTDTLNADYTDRDQPVWPMRPLLEDENGSPIVDLAGWQRRADQIRALMFRTLGPKPASQGMHGFTVGDTVRKDDVLLTLVTITVDEDDLMEAWLLEPADVPPDQRKGVALAPHGTNEHGKDYVAGTVPTEHAPYGREMAQRGWTVLAHDCHALKRRYARELRQYDTKYFYDRFPEWSSVGKIIADAQACLDVLAELPQSAGQPVATIGHSLGGQSALYAGIADERVNAAVCSCGVYPFSDSVRRSHWFRTEWYIYLQDAELKRSVIEGPQPLWDFHELAALMAPRKLMIYLAPNDYCCENEEGVTTMARELHKVWNLLDAKANLTVSLHNEGHAFEKWHREYAYYWLEGCGK